MAANELKMNDAKTEVMLITPRRMATKIECPTLVIGDHAVAPSSFVRNLGVILDSVAAMERQINAVCKTSYMHLYNISKIRCYLDNQSLACVIHAFVTCGLDYGNALSADTLERKSRSSSASRGQDYKRVSSMSRCSTHNLCSEMT